MNLISIFQRYPDQEACIEHLERVRWNDIPACPKCGSIKVGRKADGDRVGRWNCHDCHASFNVLSGTVFAKTRLPLQKWFLAVGLVLNAKKSVSSHQLARDLDLNQKSAWYLAMRVRKAMAAGQTFLSGIVEADECYVGGKPRKPNKREDDENAPRGRGTDKLPGVGAVERGGDVVAQPSEKVDGKSLAKFLRQNVDEASLLVTDQYAAYRGLAAKPRDDRSFSPICRRNCPHEHNRGILVAAKAGLVRTAPPLLQDSRACLRCRGLLQVQRPEARRRVPELHAASDGSMRIR